MRAVAQHHSRDKMDNKLTNTLVLHDTRHLTERGTPCVLPLDGSRQPHTKKMVSLMSNYSLCPKGHSSSENSEWGTSPQNQIVRSTVDAWKQGPKPPHPRPGLKKISPGTNSGTLGDVSPYFSMATRVALLAICCSEEPALLTRDT